MITYTLQNICQLGCCVQLLGPLFYKFWVEVLSHIPATFTPATGCQPQREMECQCPQENSEDAAAGEKPIYKLIEHNVVPIDINDVCTTL